MGKSRYRDNINIKDQAAGVSSGSEQSNSTMAAGAPRHSAKLEAAPHGKMGSCHKLVRTYIWNCLKERDEYDKGLTVATANIRHWRYLSGQSRMFIGGSSAAKAEELLEMSRKKVRMGVALFKGNCLHKHFYMIRVIEDRI